MKIEDVASFYVGSILNVWPPQQLLPGADLKKALLALNNPFSDVKSY